MYRVLEYTILFIVVVVLQFFLFNNLNLGVYINPLIYIAFIVMLPMEIPSIAVLMLGLLTGLTMDFTMGTSGINTIATLFTAFSRPIVLNLTVGKDEVRDGGMPTIERLGTSKYFRYTITVIFIQCLVFFTFESLTWSFYYLTLLRVGLSTAATLALVYFCELLFTIKRSKF